MSDPPYPRRVWTRKREVNARDRVNPYPLLKRHLMRLYEVYIDDGYVGDIRGADVQEARQNAIAFYNIQQDQLVTLKECEVQG